MRKRLYEEKTKAYSKLVGLIDKGIPVIPALRETSKSIESREISDAFNYLANYVEEGHPLYNAMISYNQSRDIHKNKFNWRSWSKNNEIFSQEEIRAIMEAECYGGLKEKLFQLGKGHYRIGNN